MIKIRWHGHSCFEFSNGKTLVIDPHDGASIGISPPKARADIILITHDHFDHNQARVVEKEGSVVVKESKKMNGIEIEAIKAYHDNERGNKRGEINMFKVSYDFLKFLHVGDLGHMLDEETIKKIDGIDMLFLPVGGVFTIDAKEAYEIAKKINTKIIVPMHYKIEGLSLPIDRIDKFIELSEFPIRYVANEIEIEKEDIPESKEIWIFSL
ncbi:MAG: MBL fold metallo-hydrolase [Thermoplasmata archaeon]|nr:MAG: MBL fold metallo-hydrolase [Thermoplasmata archaeon]